MMDVARIDYWASIGTGPMHRASVPAKLLFAAMVVAAAVAARHAAPLALGCCLLAAVAAGASLPWIAAGALSLYAAVFSVVYAVSLRGSPAVYALVMLKAITPAYAVGMLILSTPYPRIFSFLSVFLPEIISAGLFMTYRTFFILFELMSNFGTAIRLRGGLSAGNIVRNGANIAKGVATLFVRAVERASRLYAVMAVRGYSGSMAERTTARLKKSDWLPLCAGAAVLALSVFWR